MFIPRKLSRLKTDASNLAIEATQLQEYDRKQYLVAYYSRKFSRAEERYDVHDKKLLAIVKALEHQKIYFYSSPPFKVFIDYKNLTYFTTTKKLTLRQVRQSQELEEHKFKIVYTLGKDNSRANALSRRYNIAGTKHKDEGTLFKQNQDGSLKLVIEINNLLTITNKVLEEL